MSAFSIHEFAAECRRGAAGDLDAAERYERLGRPDDAEASRASARWWMDQIRTRLVSGRPLRAALNALASAGGES